MPIYDEVINLNIEHSNHGTDLYLPVNPQTSALVKKYYSSPFGTWFKECNCKISCCVEKFINRLNGRLWYDISFAYLPEWERRTRKQEHSHANS